MKRRCFLALSSGFGTAGCVFKNKSVGVPESFQGKNKPEQLNDSIRHDDISVTPTEYKMANEIKVVYNPIKGEPSVETISPPSNAVLAFTHIRVQNFDIEKREAPIFSFNDYQELTPSGKELANLHTNDIALRAGDELGHMPEIGNLKSFGIDQFRINGTLVAAYPNSPTGIPQDIDPNSKISGWVFAKLPKKHPIDLIVTWAGKEETWRLKTE